MLPEITLNFSGYWLSNADRPIVIRPVAARLDIVTGIDFLGVGMSVSAGATYTRKHEGIPSDLKFGLTPSVELRARLFTFGADLQGSPP